MSTSSLLVTASAGSSRYTLLVAQQQSDVRAAQRLRYRVFAEGMGAVLHTPKPGLDIDDYDAYCDHLVVREDSTGEIVGTYRMLSPEGARRPGGRARSQCLEHRACPASCARAVPGPAAPAMAARPGVAAPTRWPASTAARLPAFGRMGVRATGTPPGLRSGRLLGFTGLDRVDPRYLRHFLGRARGAEA